MKVRTQLPDQGRAFGRYATHALGVLAGLSLAACFPKLPPEEEVSDDATTEDAQALEDITTRPDLGPSTDVVVPIDIPPTECESAVDCEPLAGVCQTATCDEHRCVVVAVSDRTLCDDGALCTDKDVCTGGVCAGTPKACAAVSQCHSEGVCEATTGKCSTPTKADGTACDDEDVCTVTDTCRGGFCIGTGSPTSEGELAYAFGAEDVAYIADARGLPDGSIAGVLLASGAQRDGAFFNGATLSDHLVSIFLLRVQDVGSVAQFLEWGFRDPSTGNGPRFPFIGYQTFADGSAVFGGAFGGPFRPALGFGSDEIGASKNGLLRDDGIFVARTSQGGWTEWAVSFIGFEPGFENTSLRQVLSTNLRAESLIGLNYLRSAAATEIVDADGVGALTETFGLAKEALARLWKISSRGQVQSAGRFSASGGKVGLRGLAFLDDGQAVVTGYAVGPVTFTSNRGVDSTLPPGVDQASYSWVVLLDAEGELVWSRSVIVPRANGASGADLDVRIDGMDVYQGRIALLLGASRQLKVISSPIESAALVEGFDGGEIAPGASAVAIFALNDGVLNGFEVIVGAEVYASSVLLDERGYFVSGLTKSIFPVSGGFDTQGARRPFLLRRSERRDWIEMVADGIGGDPMTAIAASGAESLSTTLRRGADGAVWYSGLLGPRFVAGVHEKVTFDGAWPEAPAGYLLRLNKGYFFDCR